MESSGIMIFFPVIHGIRVDLFNGKNGLHGAYFVAPNYTNELPEINDLKCGLYGVLN